MCDVARYNWRMVKGLQRNGTQRKSQSEIAANNITESKIFLVKTDFASHLLEKRESWEESDEGNGGKRGRERWVCNN